jgi:hypothetical protein
MDRALRQKVDQALATMPAAYFRVTSIYETSDGGLTIRVEMPQPEMLTDTDEWAEIEIPVYDPELERLDVSNIYRMIGERTLCVAAAGEDCSGDYCYPGCPAYRTAMTWDEMRSLDQQGQGKAGTWEEHYEEVRSTEPKDKMPKDRMGGRAVSRYEMDY